MDTLPATIASQHQALQQGEISAVELVEKTLQQINTKDSVLHAFLQTFPETALAQARALDQQGAVKDPHTPLAGIPIAIKDNICTTAGHTTAASKILAQFSSPFDATAITRLRQAGAVIIGKTNLDEFAMGSSTEYSAFGVTKNPWDVRRVAGGSSGGSTTAVAAGLSVAALGSDTGGSIRQPASFCGVVGLKPTYGRVSRHGLIAYGSSLDQIGPITRTVADAALLLQIIAGSDEYDATSSPTSVGNYHLTSPDLKGVKIGVPQEFFAEGTSASVAEVVHQAIKDLAGLGASIVEISLPLTSAATAVYFLIAKAEASTNLARFDGLRYAGQKTPSEDLLHHYLIHRGQGFGPEVKRSILMGSYALSAGYADAWYKQASKVRTLIRQEYEAIFKQVDLIAGPTAPETAFTIGSKSNDPLAMYLSDALTVPMSVAGIPSVSVPCGFAKDLPVGLQLTAPAFGETKLLQVASVYEQIHNWWHKVPK